MCWPEDRVSVLEDAGSAPFDVTLCILRGDPTAAYVRMLIDRKSIERADEFQVLTGLARYLVRASGDGYHCVRALYPSVAFPTLLLSRKADAGLNRRNRE